MKKIYFGTEPPQDSDLMRQATPYLNARNAFLKGIQRPGLNISIPAPSPTPAPPPSAVDSHLPPPPPSLKESLDFGKLG